MKLLVEVEPEFEHFIHAVNGWQRGTVWLKYQDKKFSFHEEELPPDACYNEWVREMQKILIDEHIDNLSKHSLK